MSNFSNLIIYIHLKSQNVTYAIFHAQIKGDEHNKNNSFTKSKTPFRSKSGDTLLSGDLEVIASLEPDSTIIVQPESRDAMHHSEDNYYSLLEENMYLLDQLKDKEEICSHLQNELERLDDRTEKTNRNHQDEMGR